MSVKKVTAPIGCVDHEVVGITIDTTTYNALSATDLVANHSTVFSFEENPNGQTDLVFEIDDLLPEIVVTMIETSSNRPYSVTTVDYDVIGGRPTTRCPKC